MFYVSKRVKHNFLDACSQIQTGRVTIHTPEGSVHQFGSGGVESEMVIRDWSVISALAARGDVGLGEAYVDGLWETPSIEDVATVALGNADHFADYVEPSAFNRLKFRAVDRLLRANSKRGSSRNIRAHYDVGNEFYQLWLDRSMTYSSALFSEGDMDLERGQQRKYDRVLDKLSAGERTLEIGCGWGGFAERAAERGRHVTGLTISRSQKGYADARLDGRADIALRDYRAETGKYDNIVSIEMIEAVGEKYWPQYFAQLKSCLAEDGRAVVQAITVPDSNFDMYRRRSDYIRQYTFPGGMLLSDAVISHHAREVGLDVRDSYSFGADYAATCRIWAERLNDQITRIKALGFSDRFVRSWRYYLEICAASFATKGTDVVQVELSHA
ncbi:class I SAM-dependent methyltransferase [Falsiruegeria mediterranea]